MPRYNRADIQSTMRAAQRLAQGGQTRYIYATAYGFTIEKEPPPFRQSYYAVTATEINLHKYNPKGA